MAPHGAILLFGILRALDLLNRRQHDRAGRHHGDSRGHAAKDKAKHTKTCAVRSHDTPHIAFPDYETRKPVKRFIFKNKKVGRRGRPTDFFARAGG